MFDEDGASCHFDGLKKTLKRQSAHFLAQRFSLLSELLLLLWEQLDLSLSIFYRYTNGKLVWNTRKHCQWELGRAWDLKWFLTFPHWHLYFCFQCFRWNVWGIKCFLGREIHVPKKGERQQPPRGTVTVTEVERVYYWGWIQEFFSHVQKSSPWRAPDSHYPAFNWQWRFRELCLVVV